uniref:Checkpoint protein n=1 Tax=Leptobrachium leishanense TaxID=445787 RepID=A0A8C5QSS1_9ANUR
MRSVLSKLYISVIEANRNGDINLKIETDLVCVSTHFRDLSNPPWGNDAVRISNKMTAARVDIRKLLHFLAGQQVNPSKAICNIVHNQMVHFLLIHEDVSLQYFIPALS